MIESNTTAWAAQWFSKSKAHGTNTHILRDLNTKLPALFKTRKAAIAYIECHYGYIKNRPDLHNEPHGWRLPKAVRVQINVI